MITIKNISLVLFSLFVHNVQGMPNPSSVMCTSMGYIQDKEACVFPDKTRCDQWAFWRGECGKEYHICTKNQGKLVVIKKTPLCEINGRLYSWNLKRLPDRNGSQWTVVLTPENTQPVAQSAQ